MSLRMMGLGMLAVMILSGIWDGPRHALAVDTQVERVPWTTSRIHGTPQPPPPYQSERIFPKLKFTQPLDIAFAPGSSRLFVVEQGGKIVSFPNDPACEKVDVLIDLKAQVQSWRSVDEAKGIGWDYVSSGV